MDDAKGIEKQMELTEGMRKVLNQAINLLHQSSHQKISVDEAQDTLKELFISYQFVNEKENARVKELHSEAFDILKKVWEKDIPLYEAIMMMNTVIMEIKTLSSDYIESDNIQEKISISFIEEKKSNVIDPIFKGEEEGEIEMIKEEKIDKEKISGGKDIHDLLSRVIDSKKQLQNTICSLNDSLEAVGLQIKEL